MSSGFFSNPGFMPHIHCYLGKPSLVWTMFVTDLLIGSAYLGISLTLWILVKNIKLPINLIVVCFGTFIFACGLTHFMEVWTLWSPNYWGAAWIKVVTALASVGTGIILYRMRVPIIKLAETAKMAEQKDIGFQKLIDELKRNLTEMREETERKYKEFEEFFELSAVGAKVIDSKTLKFLRVNQKFCDMTGYSKEELLNRTFLDITHPEDRESEVKNYFQLCCPKKTQWTIEKRYITKQGEIVWVLINGTVICNNKGLPMYSFAVCQDTTERKKNDEHQKKLLRKIEESELRFRQLADAMPQIVWTARPDGYVDYYNERWYEFTGSDRDTLGDESWLPILHPDDAHKCLDSWHSSVRTGEPYQLEYRFWDRKTKDWRWFIGRALPVRNENGQIAQWFGTNTDIDDLKRAQESLLKRTKEIHHTQKDLKDAIRARDEFLSIASHELKTPLTTLKMQGQILQRGIAKGDSRSFQPEQIDRFAKLLDSQVDRLNRLVNDMLDVGRIQTGRLSLNLEHVNLCDILKEIVDRLRPQMVEAQTTPEVETCESIVGNWDKFRIEQVIVNLLTNAIRYGNKKPVRIRLQRNNGSAIISVQDHGIGVSKKSQQRIFNRFERAVASSKVSGLGLGLFISREIVKAHHGRIWVESEGEGKGSIFFVELPVFSENSQKIA